MKFHDRRAIFHLFWKCNDNSLAVSHNVAKTNIVTKLQIQVTEKNTSPAITAWDTITTSMLFDLALTKKQQLFTTILSTHNDDHNTYRNKTDGQQRLRTVVSRKLYCAKHSTQNTIKTTWSNCVTMRSWSSAVNKVIHWMSSQWKLEGHSVERMYLRQRCSDGWVNKTILKPRVAAAAGRQYVYVGFSRRKIVRSSAHTILDKAIRFQHPDYYPDWAQKLISSSMSQHLSTGNISSKSMQTFLSNLANRQTDKLTRAKTFTSSLVGGNNSKD